VTITLSRMPAAPVTVTLYVPKAWDGSTLAQVLKPCLAACQA
jgi:hypothetical protein